MTLDLGIWPLISLTYKGTPIVSLTLEFGSNQTQLITYLYSQVLNCHHASNVYLPWGIHISWSIYGHSF